MSDNYEAAVEIRDALQDVARALLEISKSIDNFAEMQTDMLDLLGKRMDVLSAEIGGLKE